MTLYLDQIIVISIIFIAIIYSIIYHFFTEKGKAELNYKRHLAKEKKEKNKEFIDKWGDKK